jgi:hypothetical protein
MPGSFLHPFTPPRKSEFLSIARGSGALVWDDAGNSYIDGMASLWYVNIGHGREEMAAAIAAQARTLAAYHAFDPFTNGPADQAADKISELSPYDESRVFFGTSGSEAVDTAMKLARIAQREARTGSLRAPRRRSPDQRAGRRRSVGRQAPRRRRCRRHTRPPARRWCDHAATAAVSPDVPAAGHHGRPDRPDGWRLEDRSREELK